MICPNCKSNEPIWRQQGELLPESLGGGDYEKLYVGHFVIFVQFFRCIDKPTLWRGRNSWSCDGCGFEWDETWPSSEVLLWTSP